MANGTRGKDARDRHRQTRSDGRRSQGSSGTRIKPQRPVTRRDLAQARMRGWVVQDADPGTPQTDAAPPRSRLVGDARRQLERDMTAKQALLVLARRLSGPQMQVLLECAVVTAAGEMAAAMRADGRDCDEIERKLLADLGGSGSSEGFAVAVREAVKSALEGRVSASPR